MYHHHPSPAYPLPFATATFDYVRMAFVFDKIRAQEWEYVVRELVRVTKKGGWIELAELEWPARGWTEKLDKWMGWSMFCLKTCRVTLQSYG